MIVRVSPAVGDQLYAGNHAEPDALLLAVRHVVENGADAEVVDRYGNVVWYAEADEPIGDTQPVIVHFRDPGPSTGAQC